MSKTLKIAEIGNPVLRSPAEAVTDIQSPTFQQLIDDLIATALENNGVGIAAPQVSQSLQLFVVASRPNLRYLHAPKMDPTPMINPKILHYSDEVVAGWEGCLSVPGMRGLVTRSKAVEVLYTDHFGQQHQQTFTDFVARIIQHEYDHIRGKVFLDRVDSTLDLMSEAEYHARVVCG